MEFMITWTERDASSLKHALNEWIKKQILSDALENVIYDITSDINQGWTMVVIPDNEAPRIMRELRLISTDYVGLVERPIFRQIFNGLRGRS